MGIFRSQGKVYKPAADVDLGPDSDEVYVKANVKAPRLAGLLARIFVWFLESSVVGPLLVYVLKRGNLIHKFVSHAEIEEAPLFTPSHAWEDPGDPQVRTLRPHLSPAERIREAAGCVPGSVEGEPESVFFRRGIRDFSRAYVSRQTSPLQVARRFISALQESNDEKMSFFITCSEDEILKQAAESTERYRRGNQICILDGILIAIKDEIDCKPYPTTGGTRWLHKFRACTEDAHCVKILRACGAILVGKTNMHELGAGTSGINPHYGAVRNPYNPGRISGGSSSGSAAAVCAGLCPVALGVDGGGSVRMPASLCGIVGLKPTCGRFSHDGVLPLNWTVGNLGILSGTVEDALIVYAALSDQLLYDKSTYIQPELNIPLLSSSKSIPNIKFGKYRKWFNDCHDDIRHCSEQALDMLCESYRWKIMDITVPEIEEMRLAHYLTIGAECTTSLATCLDQLDFTLAGCDARVALKVYGSFSSKEYLNAQRLRSRQMYFHKEIFKLVDVIVTPTTGVTAYEIKDDAFETGELDYINGAALIRYSISGNFLGLPTITLKVGYDKEGMPIGLQFIGKPWSEATLIHLAYVMQELCIKTYRKPEVFFDLLKID